MLLNEAKEILKNNGYILKEAIDYDAWLTHNPADDYDRSMNVICPSRIDIIVLKKRRY